MSRFSPSPPPSFQAPIQLPSSPSFMDNSHPCFPLPILFKLPPSMVKKRASAVTTRIAMTLTKKVDVTVLTDAMHTNFIMGGGDAQFHRKFLHGMSTRKDGLRILLPPDPRFFLIISTTFSPYCSRFLLLLHLLNTANSSGRERGGGKCYFYFSRFAIFFSRNATKTSDDARKIKP